MEMAVLVHRSDMSGSKSQYGSLNKIIKLHFLLIMISPQRMSYVESLDNHDHKHLSCFYELVGLTGQTKRACFSLLIVMLL